MCLNNFISVRLISFSLIILSPPKKGYIKIKGYNDRFPLLSLNISSQIQKARRMIQIISVAFIID